jgi:hypothetical protein
MEVKHHKTYIMMPNSAHHEDNGIAACVLTLLLDRKMSASHTGKAPPVPTR